jgi:hypothetical protein
VRRLLALVALVTVACDDPAVGAKAADVLVHGVTEAEVACAGTFVRTGDGTFPFKYRLAKLVDGSAFVSLSAHTTKQSLFSSRTSVEPDFAVVADAFDGITFAVAGGSLTLAEVSGANIDETVDLDTECTGFNLEAFGVEP